MSELSEKEEELLNRIKILEESNNFSDFMKKKMTKIKSDILTDSSTPTDSIEKSLKIYEELLQKLKKIYGKENNLLKQLYDKILNIEISRLRISDDKKEKLKNLISKKLKAELEEDLEEKLEEGSEEELSAEETTKGNSTIIHTIKNIIKKYLSQESNLETVAETPVPQDTHSNDSIKDKIKNYAKNYSLSLLLKSLSNIESIIYEDNLNNVVERVIHLIKTRIEHLKDMLPDILLIIKFMHKDGCNMKKTINKTIQLIIIFSILNVIDIIRNEVILTEKQLINLTDSVYNMIYSRLADPNGFIIEQVIKYDTISKGIPVESKQVQIKFQSYHQLPTNIDAAPEIIVVLEIPEEKPIPRIFSKVQIFKILILLLGEFKDISIPNSSDLKVENHPEKKFQLESLKKLMLPGKEAILLAKKKLMSSKKKSAIDEYIDSKDYNDDEKYFINFIDKCISREPPILISSNLKIKIKRQFLKEVKSVLSNTDTNSQILNNEQPIKEGVIKLFSDYLVNSISKSDESGEIKLVENIKKIVLNKLDTHLLSDGNDSYIDLFSIDSEKFPDDLKLIFDSLFKSLDELNNNSNK